ncbi:zinc-binding dehydrogenase [Parapedobacter tibetensis]|uniref:zinc-binding dehydrogenase n=1 Tax=Parapedobacter tibetensis TaxID=2972951 RepID=UPI00214DBD60|nr:zinc-binding dehydrogenase [Parapedobacter tibetensis]
MNTNLIGKIAVFTATGQPLEIRSYTVPALQAGEVLVENLYTTLCGSDLHTFCGVRQEKTPSVLGHEIVGRIVAIDEQHGGYDHAGQPLRTGDIVTWSIFASDPQSTLATQGMPQKGDGLFKYGHAQLCGEDIFHGGLAEYCILKPYTAILRIPDELPLPVAATINCAVATVAGALRLAGSLRDKKVLITGMGLLGMVCAAMCKDAGASSVAAADISEVRLQRSIQFGVDRLINLQADEGNAMQKTIDVVFDMSGSPDAMEMGLDTLSTGGIAIWVGAVFNARKLQVDAESIIRRLVTIKGLHNYNYDDLQHALNFLLRNFNNYPFDGIVEKEFPLSEAQQAFDYALDNKPLRVGIKIGE